MGIQLVTYANQTVTPTNDAIIYERAIDQNGIFYGCNVTISGNEVHITGGYGIICGREFTIQSEAIAVTLAPSGTLDGRLYVRLDLADADAPIQLLTATGNTLPPLEQDADVNYTNGAYEMELATFTVGVSALSDVVETFETIVGINDKIANFLKPTELWSGSWSSSTITVPNTANYSFFLVVCGGSLVLCLSDGSTVEGSIVTSSGNSDNQYTKVFRATISGNVWTMVFSKQLVHYVSSNHGTSSGQTITKVIGLF